MWLEGAVTPTGKKRHASGLCVLAWERGGLLDVARWTKVMIGPCLVEQIGL